MVSNVEFWPVEEAKLDHISRGLIGSPLSDHILFNILKRSAGCHIVALKETE